MNDSPDMATATLDELRAMQASAEVDIANAKARIAMVGDALSARFTAAAKAQLTAKGKEHGSVTIDLPDGFKLKADAKQTVKWDSDALQEIASTLPWDRVAALFNIKFSMSETIYKGVSALSPELRQKIDAARTTETKPFAFKLEKAEG